MIRDAVIHMQGEQPLVADLPTLPSAGDSCLVCTNMRTLDGKRPVFVDEVGSTFIIPLQHVRFIEILPDGGSTSHAHPALEAGEPASDEAAAELDEDFLRRIREA
jgi:hypothetical protein